MVPAAFLVVAPSTIEVNEEFSLGLKALGEPYAVGIACYGAPPTVLSQYNLSPRGIAYMDNVPPQWEGTVQLQGALGYQGPETFSFAGRSGPYRGDTRPIARIAGLRFSTPGVKRLEVVDPASGARGLSNPIEVSASPLSPILFT